MADEKESIQGGDTNGLAGETADTRRDNPTADRSVLESKVSASLAAFREIDTPADEPAERQPAEVEPTDEEIAEQPAAEAAGDTETPEVADDAAKPEDGADDAEKQTPKPEVKASGPTLPDAIKRSLHAYGWDDEDIAKAMKADPANFTAAAQKIHQNRNAEVSQWAALGRAARQNAGEVEQGRAPKNAQPQSPHVNPKTGLFKPLDVDALVEAHGEDKAELITELAGPLNAALAQINQYLPVLQTGVESINKSRVESLTKQVDEFFGGKDLTAFAGLYGDGKNELTDKHLETRNKVLELADALVSGARLQGRTLSNAEAMLMAHDSVSSGFKAQAARKEVQGKVETRGKALTVRPTQKGARDPKAAPGSRGELEARTRSRLAAVFPS